MEIKQIPINEIKTDVIVNCRNVVEVEDLMESIQETGLQMPIGVTTTVDGEYGLVYGFRRLTACKNLGYESISARIVNTYGEAELLIMNLQENVSRKNLTPMEEAHAIQRIIEAGKSIDEFRAALGWSKTIVTQRLALLDMSLPLQDALEGDSISVNQARAICEADESHHDSLIKLAEGGCTAKALKDEIEQLERVGEVDDSEDLVLVEDDEVIFTPEDDEKEIERENAKALAEANSNLILANLLDIGAKAIKDSSALFAYQVAIQSLDFSKLPKAELSSLFNAVNTLHGEYGLDAWGEHQRNL